MLPISEQKAVGCSVKPLNRKVSREQLLFMRPDADREKDFFKKSKTKPVFCLPEVKIFVFLLEEFFLSKFQKSPLFKLYGEWIASLTWILS